MRQQILLALSLILLAAQAQADLGSDIKSQCSIQTLNQTDNAKYAANGNLTENRLMHEYFSGKPAAGSETAADADAGNHRRTQLRVENIKFAQNKCILGIIQSRLGKDMTFAKMKDDAKAQALMKEFEAFSKDESKKLNEIRAELVRCEKLKDTIEKRNCKLKALEEEIAHFEPSALYKEMIEAQNSKWPAWQKKSLAAYEKERLQNIRDFIKEMNDDAASAGGDRFEAIPDEGKR